MPESSSSARAVRSAVIAQSVPLMDARSAAPQEKEVNDNGSLAHERGTNGEDVEMKDPNNFAYQARDREVLTGKEGKEDIVKDGLDVLMHPTKLIGKHYDLRLNSLKIFQGQ